MELICAARHCSLVHEPIHERELNTALQASAYGKVRVVCSQDWAQMEAKPLSQSNLYTHSLPGRLIVIMAMIMSSTASIFLWKWVQTVLCCSNVDSAVRTALGLLGAFLAEDA